MKDFLKKNKIQLIIVGYLILLALIAYFVIASFVGRIIGKADEIQQKQIDSELAEKRLSDVPVMEENFVRFKDNEDKFYIAIEPNSEVELIKELEALAEETKNKIEFQIQETPSKPAAKQKGAEADIKSKLAQTNYLSMKIAIEGDYASLINFIRKLENYKKTVNIMSVSSEKKEMDSPEAGSSPFVAAAGAKNKVAGKEIINSIFDVVVYIKK